MTEKIRRNNPYKELQKSLITHCEACSGLCCTALYFSKSEGFPEDKPPGVPCPNLAEDFRCSIHKELSERGLRGCCAFDCMGAGQQVTQAVYGGKSWRTLSESSAEIYEVFLRVRRLHQMLWYLTDAASFTPAVPIESDIDALVQEASSMRALDPKAILSLAVDSFQDDVNEVLKQAAALVQNSSGNGSGWSKKSPAKKNIPGDFMGKNLRRQDLRGRDFSMALLIAADLDGCCLRGSNLLGADLRDANLRNADLSESLFLTQGQINGAKGCAKTKLPPSLTAPASWAL